MRPRDLTLASLLLLVAGAVPAMAQRGTSDDDASWLENCRRSGWGDDDRGRACEVRVVPVHLSGRSIEIDATPNGSVRVRGWDGDSVRVTARLQANAPSDAEAKALLAGVQVSATDAGVHATGPSTERRDRTGWSAGYVVFVPRHFSLKLASRNGSIRVADVDGRLDLQTENGSVGLDNVSGDVHARTRNGSLDVQLAGARWEGRGLDAETQNGSVRLSVPERYSAQLETGTVNGRIRSDIPITVQGHITRQLSVPLNGGGPTVRAMTTNGSVTIRRN